MNRKNRIIISLLAASVVTILHIGWRKFGGLISGVRYSDTHNLTELFSYLPEIVFLFAIVFTGVFVWEGLKRKKIYLKCPQCGKIETTFENVESICQECGTELDSLDGFYKRHPDIN